MRVVSVELFDPDEPVVLAGRAMGGTIVSHLSPIDDDRTQWSP